jgi:hypothetical protein
MAGGYAALGLATDRFLYPAPIRAPSTLARSLAEAPAPKPAPEKRPVLSQKLARDAVQAAWRAAGVPASESRMDSMARRARLSGALPETRLRVVQWVDDRLTATGEWNEDPTRAYATQGTRRIYEARLTWRLDRLLFAEDETTLERLRYDQELARLRIAGQVLEALFAWQRAVVDAREAEAGTREELDAQLRVSESDAMLDVMTGGWWSTRR